MARPQKKGKSRKAMGESASAGAKWAPASEPIRSPKEEPASCTEPTQTPAWEPANPYTLAERSTVPVTQPRPPEKDVGETKGDGAGQLDRSQLSAEPARLPRGASDRASDSHGNSHRTPNELHSRIAALAYVLYEESGFQEGHDLEHWLEAERQVKKSGL